MLKLFTNIPHKKILCGVESLSSCSEVAGSILGPLYAKVSLSKTLKPKLLLVVKLAYVCPNIYIICVTYCSSEKSGHFSTL